MFLKARVGYVKNSVRNFLKKFFALRRTSIGGRELVKRRPSSLDQKYHLLTDDGMCDEFFLRLRRRVYQALDVGGVTAYRESGRLSTGRPYFFVKPFNQSGWLFERSSAGWVVAQAEKLAVGDTFLRDQTLLDQASVLVPEDPERLPRIRSATLGEEMISVALYEKRILDTLGLGGKEKGSSGI
jgi:hypothetical protein